MGARARDGPDQRAHARICVPTPTAAQARNADECWRSGPEMRSRSGASHARGRRFETRRAHDEKTAGNQYISTFRSYTHLRSI